MTNMGELRQRLLRSGFVGVDLVPAIDLTPVRITLWYLVLGFGALYISDVLIVPYLSEPVLSQLQALKGGIEVVLTGGFIYLLTARRETQLSERRQSIEEHRKELKLLHRVFRHNLRNDLNIIQGYVGMLCEEETPETNVDACGTLDQALERVERYTTNAERINRITSQSSAKTRFDLAARIPDVCAAFEEPGEVEIQQRLPRQGPDVMANARFLDCLEELLTNAIQHSDTEPVRIRVSVSQDAVPSDVVEVRIEDNGPGLPELEKQALREGEEGDLLHLSGMGLWFVSWTLQHSDGSLELEERPTGGTTAILRVLKARDSDVSW